MRVPYFEPTSTDFDRAFDTRNFQGGGLNDIRVYQQRGGSLLGILSGFAARALPFLRSIILPEIGNFTKNVTSDYGNNIPMKQSLKRNAVSSGKNIARKLMGGSRKHNISKKKNIKKKQARKPIRMKTLCKPLEDVFGPD